MAADGSRSFNDKLAEDYLTHAIDLLRFEAGERQRMAEFLRVLEAELTTTLARIDPMGVRESARAKRLEKLLIQARETIKTVYRDMRADLRGDLRELAQIESSFVLNSINGNAGFALATASVAPDQLRALVGDVLIQGAPVAEWFERQAADTMQRFTDTMRVGIAAGETNAQLIQRVRGGNRDGVYFRGIMDVSRHHADGLVRAATQAVSAASRDLTYNANADIISAVVWTATLDSRTTIECAARDGKRYTLDHKPIGHDLPWHQGPGNLHWGCRSSSRPEIKSWRELGIDIDDLPPGTRASMDGQVAADQKFPDWLKAQSEARQNEVLGKGRADLWRSGRITFRDLLDQNGRELSLEELRRRVGA